MQIEWRSVLGHPRYEVSRCGYIRDITSGKMLNKYLVRGYHRVNLVGPNGRRQWSFHRVLWEAFNGPIPAKMQINHKDGVKDNNALENLEVVTPRENLLHAYRIGLKKSGDQHPNRLRPWTRPRGESHKMSKLTAVAVRAIRDEFASGASKKGLARKYSVTKRAIQQVVNRLTWNHVA